MRGYLTDEIGKQLGAEYIDIQPMSEGGMGTLFRAHRLGLDVDVVIKRFKQKYLGALDQRAEADILKRLKHRYLPRIYDIIQGSDGYVYTVMDLIPGRNMRQIVKENGPVDQRSAHRWACQLCEVVAYLHEQEPVIIHRDIKPSNVMITPEGNICLIDFNTSLTYADDTIVNAVTHGFAAPEQYLQPAKTAGPPAASGLTATETASTEYAPTGYRPEELTLPAPPPAPAQESRSGRESLRSSQAAQSTRAGGYGGIAKCTDVYSIGATLYYLVTGCTPEKALDPITPLSEHAPPISATFASIIMRAMEKQPERRFPDAAHMLQALQDVDLLDARYRRCHLARTITRGIFAVLFCASLACTGYGVMQLYQGRQNAYLTLVTQSETLSTQGDTEGAVDLLEQAIDMSPDRAEAYLRLAVEWYQQAQYQQALDLLNNAESAGSLLPDQLSDDQAGDFYYIQANCLYEIGDYASAMAQYQRALERRTDNDAYYRGLAMAQARGGDLDGAQQTLETLEARGAASVDCQVVQAEINTVQGMFDEALAGYRSVLQQSDDAQILSRCYLAAAQICQQQGDLDGSIQLLRQAVESLGDASPLHAEMLAQVLSEKAQADPASSAACYQEAEAVLQAVMDRGQGNALTALNLAMVQQNLGAFDRAEQTLLAMCQQYPTDYRPYMRLAFLYADWQDQKPVAHRDYAQVEQYAGLARQYYQQAVANGVSDMEMSRLDNLLEQLQVGGWLS